MDNATEFYHIRNALLEAALADYQDAAALPPEAPAFSPRYRRWEKTFLRDPFASLHRGRLGRKRALRLALCAAILLAVSVGTVWMAGPEAPVLPGTWSFEAHEAYDSYQFHGNVPAGEMALWAPRFLPEGYEQTEFENLGNLVNIFYDCNDLDLWIQLSYLKMKNGSSFHLDNERHSVSAISVKGLPGQLYTALDDSTNMLTWFNRNAGYAFLVSSRLGTDTLLDIAESVSLVCLSQENPLERPMDPWTLGYLPEGYTQTAYYDLPNQVDCFYNCADQELFLHFSYQRVLDGSGWTVDNEHNVRSEVSIHDLSGVLYTSTDTFPNMLLWHDSEEGYSFFLASRLPTAELVRIAENVRRE